MLKQTGLYVITGGPGTGKTSLIEELERSEFKAVEEVAREIIKEIGLPDKENIEQAVAKYRYSKQVFILPPWEDIYCTDKERKQLFNEAIDTYYVMKEVYEKAGYTLIEIPKVPVTERRDFVIDSIRLF